MDRSKLECSAKGGFARPAQHGRRRISTSAPHVNAPCGIRRATTAPMQRFLKRLLRRGPRKKRAECERYLVHHRGRSCALLFSPRSPTRSPPSARAEERSRRKKKCAEPEQRAGNFRQEGRGIDTREESAGRTGGRCPESPPKRQSHRGSGQARTCAHPRVVVPASGPPQPPPDSAVTTMRGGAGATLLLVLVIAQGQSSARLSVGVSPLEVAQPSSWSLTSAFCAQVGRSLAWDMHT
ncbi:hypothetical protein HPB51_003690 [Rhipicephalus microplus]|uniref:Uncharacterized protein n=1 Tax=Rhipicephalus microplus TaxID=6941 RepID=A0A9J6EF55_RHIMP|nr:hypothetical protein HPB51_003690 [Rhipicephalus microplus]